MSAAQPKEKLAWVEAFLTALRTHGVATEAARVAGVPLGTVKSHRRRNAGFADRWREALRQAPRRPKSIPPPPSPREGNAGKPVNTAWRKDFLRALAETSCVSAAAATARVEPSRAYRLRRENGAFAAEWRAALAEGYEHLEQEVLAYLRGARPTPRLDVANAIRLLAAHRDTVARERALREDDDEEAVLDSIDRFIDDMRARREANAPLLIEYGPARDEAGSGEQGSGDDAQG